MSVGWLHGKHLAGAEKEKNDITEWYRDDEKRQEETRRDKKRGKEKKREEKRSGSAEIVRGSVNVDKY